MGAILYTEGGELQYLDGRDYIGSYHIMPDGTPMGGAVHTGKEDILKFSTNRATVSSANLNDFLTQPFELSDSTIIPNFDIPSFYDPTVDRIEFHIYSADKTLLSSNPNFRNYRVQNDQGSEGEIEEIQLFPSEDISNAGFDKGSLFALYNFITPEISDIFISEISPDRTEIRLQSNFLTSEEIREEVVSLKTKIESVGYFDEFYLNFGRNNYYICVNIQLDETTSPTSFLIKLYEPLPASITTKTTLEVVSKISETQAFQVSYPSIPTPDDVLNTLRGPNTNLEIKDRVNNSTEFKNLTTLTTSSFTSSLDQSSYLLKQTGIKLNPSYSISSYSDFVHFSSAKKRLENFYYKVSQIESNQNSITSLRTITGGSSGSITTTTSIKSFQDNITELIRNFDGFEYFLYYNSGSNSYPKSNSSAPYILQSTGSAEVLTWLGSDDITNAFYGGALLDASRFDDNNPSNLKYTIPEFIRDNSDNNNYIEFVNLVGQHFDEIWLYVKAITDKLSATNNLETGIQPELVEETLKSFGYEVYGNNFDNNDIFTSLIGINESGSYFSETNRELITTAISASNTPVPINDVSKEVYKRLYHNLVYLAKRKGTVSGLRSLINIWGLPDTILRIYEFGGKDKINSNDWDLYRRIYNREIVTHQFDADKGQEYNGGVETEWKINSQWSASAAVSNLTGSVPSTVEFRFKSDIDPATTPTQSIPLQPLWGLKDDGGDTKVLVYLEYKGSGSFSSSFSGSTIDPNYQYADLTLAVSGSPPTSASISLPFYNKDWWNVRVQMQEQGLANINQSRYQLASANKIYNGKDGTQIGFKDGIKLNQISGSWVNSTTSSFALERSFNSKTYNNFSGSIQELRYWTLCFNNQSTITEEVWDNHVMDPLSIETGYLTGSLSPVENLVFRSREGEDIGLITGSQGNISFLNSIHPKISGSYSTISSFNDNSRYSLITSSIASNREIQFLNQPNLGIKNRVSDKIHIYNNVAYSDTLSSYRSIQQNYEASQSFTEDNNLLQVAFSPQDEVNDDIINELGFNNKITETLADPRNLSSSLDYYDGLRDIALRYFEKYVKTNANDYYRLIKYIDNSLFKAIKNYIPARTSVSTGIVVKQHLLERNRVRPPQVDLDTTIAKTSEGSFNTDFIFKDITVSGAIKSQPRGYITGSSIEVFSGGTGGSFEKFNSLHFHPYGVSGSGPTKRFGYDITQSFIETVTTLSGSVNTTISNQDEFYNGEFNGANIVVTTQSLNPACEKFLNVNISAGELSHQFDRFVYTSNTCSLAKFNDIKTAPRSGEIFLFRNSSNLNNIEKIKISHTTKGGVDLSTILPAVDRFTFDFDGNNKGVNVDFDYGGGSYTTFDVTSPLFTYDSTNFSSNFVPYPFTGSKTGSHEAITVNWDGNKLVKGGTAQAAIGYNTQEVIVSDYQVESDSHNLFNTSSGIYTCPLTNNKFLSVTSSLSSFTINWTNNISYSIDTDVQFRVKNLSTGEELDSLGGFQTTVEQTSSIGQAYSGPEQKVLLTPSQAIRSGDQVALVAQLNTAFTPFQAIIPGQSAAANITASFSFSNALFAISESIVTDSNPVSTLTAIEPAFTVGDIGFDREFDCQPLLNNSIENRDSTLYQDVDYSTGLLVPTNVIPITNNDANPAQTPDSNYSQLSRTLLRYKGSKLEALRINAYNGAGAKLKDGTTWLGDISFGKTPVINRVKPFFTYFQLLVPTSPELENATQVKLAYLINSNGDAFKPLLNSDTFFDVEGTYESGDRVDIALEDTLQTDDASLVNAAVGINLDNFNTGANVIYGARRVDPIITSQRVSVNDVSNISDAFENTITFTSILGEPNNFYFLAASNFNSITYQTQNNHTLLGYSTFSTQDSMGGFDATTGIYTIQSPGPVPGNDISFEIRGAFKINSLLTSISNLSLVAQQIGSPQAKIQIIRNRSSVETILAEEILNYTFALNLGATPPFVTEFQQVNLVSSPTEMRVGDEVFARLVIINPNAFEVVNANRALIGTPISFPTTTVEPDFFKTGSNYTNFITASVSFSQFVDLSPQQPYANSTFKPINENISFRPGDELRFEGSEALAFKIYDVDLVTSGHASGSFLLNVQPEVPPKVNLNQFLLRRYNPDATSVLIDLVPPSSSFATTKGVMKSTLISEELGQNINSIVSDLVKEGVISSNGG
tara:strand:+ start:8099 stop:14605 length:6507 start_codon:yes stop_codon:yes gene_type:complete